MVHKTEKKKIVNRKVSRKTIKYRKGKRVGGDVPYNALSSAASSVALAPVEGVQSLGSYFTGNSREDKDFAESINYVASVPGNVASSIGNTITNNDTVMSAYYNVGSVGTNVGKGAQKAFNNTAYVGEAIGKGASTSGNYLATGATKVGSTVYNTSKTGIDTVGTGLYKTGELASSGLGAVGEGIGSLGSVFSSNTENKVDIVAENPNESGDVLPAKVLPQPRRTKRKKAKKSKPLSLPIQTAAAAGGTRHRKGKYVLRKIILV